MTAEDRINSLEKRIRRLERKLMQKEVTQIKFETPKSKSYLKQQQRYNLRKSIAGIK